MSRYVCIHGHFYQPPRENAWLESVELQDSARPFHDWNERVTAEAYAPNAASRILDGEGRIVRIVSNYARINFNFGPTLLRWLEQQEPLVYQAVLDADRESREKFSGHGSAIAQGFHHVILPLANERDKRTQVAWGIRDFEARFGRFPESMWLPETAADTPTLEVLAEAGLGYVILAPNQAQRVRKIGSERWMDVSGDRIDPRKPYVANLPSGRSIALFFYDGPASRGIAFEGLLRRGEAFADRLRGLLIPEKPGAQLAHVATDGETYGHHHRHGDMALAFALEQLDRDPEIRLTNYGEFLERHPPEHEVEIVESSSWSCAHGVERWRSDCGCHTGGDPGWNQAWRAPLREALDGLRDAVEGPWEEHASALLRDPWAARDAYVEVVLDRSPENVTKWLGSHARKQLTPEERTRTLKLMELQRHAMLMYTSCGWFFNELSGIETVQVLQYAGRLVQLGEELFEISLGEAFLADLAKAESNIPEHGNGRTIFEKFVVPSMVDLHAVAAHHAISSPFETYSERSQVSCYTVEREDYRLLESGSSRCAVGRASVGSTITEETARLTFGVLHFGGHNLTGGVRDFAGEDAYAQLVSDVTAAFERADLPGVIRQLDHYFGELTYSLRSLFRDEQRKILDEILRSTLEEAEVVYQELYERHAPLIRFLADLQVPLPSALELAAELVLNVQLRRTLEEDVPDADTVRDLVQQARERKVPLDADTLGFAVSRSLERLADALRDEPTNVETLEALEAVVGLKDCLPFETGMWKAQNVHYETVQELYPEMQRRARAGDADAEAWIARFTSLGKRLNVFVP